MQARKLSAQEVQKIESEVLTPVKMTKNMHAMCKLINVARFNSALDTQKESN